MEQQVFNDRYKIIAKIGSGGMADVYKAIDTVLDRPVAVKVLHKYFAEDEDFVSRFRREAQAAASLNHPNIVNIYDWGSENGTYFIVMELLEGQSLKKYISSKGTIKPREAVEIARKVLSALNFAHKHNIVHRDIKPHNIILTRGGEVKVTDFGIARAGTSTMTQTGTILGTAHYLSPEQARGQDVGVTSDIYSMGVVLYEMLTGRVPFDGDNPVAIALKHVHEFPIPPRDINPDIPDELQIIVAKAMAKNPDSRYQSASEMRNDLMRLLEGMPIAATPPDEQETLVMAPPGNTAQVDRTMYANRNARGPRPIVIDKPKRRGRGPLMVAAVILILVLAGWLAYAAGLGQKKVVEVPNVQGKTFEEAESILKKAGLKIAERDREFSNTMEPGRIISQDPGPGEKKDAGSTVYVVLSKGKNMKKVPDVTGDREATAASKLMKAGLDIGDTKNEFSDEVDEGTVIRTDPEAGQEVPEGTKVDLYISRGPETAQVTDVYGKTSTEAQEILKEAGFNVAIAEEFSDSYAKGTVIRTSPASGTEAKKTSTVTIFVSKGPEMITVPNVIGKQEEDAAETLEGAGFEVKVEDIKAPSQDQDGKVISQDPSANQQIKKNGASITIYVGQWP
ncbi:MAG: Stk1 family PASTA domain-containing Ser/Thr kinase [Firmicutes bacterium]|nr:Stk1 family PASTA domain-containing Ser/Thr kinase [Bacillota bacterium]